MPHLAYTLLVALALSVALALIGNRSLPERLHAATYRFLCFAASTLAVSWIMRLVHG